MCEVVWVPRLWHPHIQGVGRFPCLWKFYISFLRILQASRPITADLLHFFIEPECFTLITITGSTVKVQRILQCYIVAKYVRKITAWFRAYWFSACNFLSTGTNANLKNAVPHKCVDWNKLKPTESNELGKASPGGPAYLYWIAFSWEAASWHVIDGLLLAVNQSCNCKSPLYHEIFCR